ncbi:MAG TPA: redoxin domain-containing protein [Aggregatilineales bacterium]|nr:redoxin domain-containing protein [Aggregatilineales bacterium]
MTRLLLSFMLMVLGFAAFRPVRSASPLDPASLDDLGPAPELTNDVWINTDYPLRLADLRGKVILLQFWTFACYNCQNTLPFMRATYDAYMDNPNVQIIGIHFPEMSYERVLANVQQAVKDDQIHYPVAIDNDGAAWYAYEMHAWPAFIIIDKNGHMRYRQIGEGAYDRMKNVINALLTEPAATV